MNVALLAVCRDIAVHLDDGIPNVRPKFDRAYYDRWYRHPRHRIATPAEIARRVAVVLGVAEWVLGRTVRHVLDLGCGEGLWRAPLEERRPSLAYDGVDPSAYVVERFGRRRGIRQGTFGTFGALALRARYDVIVCTDVLHYVGAAEVRQGLEQVSARLGGVAYLPVVTSADDVEGDVRALTRRSPAWYRARFRDAGLAPIGLECYVPRAALGDFAALERCGG